MQTYNEFKIETFSSASMLLGGFTQLLLGPVLNFSALGGNLAWAMWFTTLVLVCALYYAVFYGITFIGEKVNKKATEMLLIDIVKRMRKTFQKYVALVSGNEE